MVFPLLRVERQTCLINDDRRKSYFFWELLSTKSTEPRIGRGVGEGGRVRIESRMIRGKLQGRRSSMVEFDPWYLAVDETGNSEEFRESGAGH